MNPFSCLTYQTDLSFTSSNSSFSDCLRYHSSSHIYSSHINSIDCDPDCEGRDLASQQFFLDDSPTHTFTSCAWTGCSAVLGGAISFQEQTSSSLFVSRCIFYSCKSTSPEWETGGGAIHCNNVNFVSIISSSFLSCTCEGGGGGGINFCNIQNQPSLSECDIISCSASADGGGISIFYSYANVDQLICNNCRFLSCCISNNLESEYIFSGGGIILWQNHNILICSDILFTSNTGTCGGGYATSQSTVLQTCFLCFCFFNRNTGSCGTDAYFDPLPSDAFQHCFSTSDSHRIGYYSSGYQKTDENWLLQKTINEMFTKRHTITKLAH